MTSLPADRRIWLWAHGPVDAPDGALIGWRDVALSDPAGERRRAEILAARIGSATTVFASDRQRTRRLARTLARSLGARLEITAALREINYGAWEGLTWAEVRRQHGPDHTAYMADWHGSPMPGGESYADLQARVNRWWTGLRTAGPIVVVAHAGSLRALAAEVLGWQPEDAVGVALARGHYAVIDPDGAQPPGWNLPLPD